MNTARPEPKRNPHLYKFGTTPPVHWPAQILLLALAFFVGTASADSEKSDLDQRFGRYYVTYRVHADGTAVETREWSRTVLRKEALSWAKSDSVTYSTSAQQGEVLEAYTLKADGKQIRVPKRNYQIEINRGKDKDSPVYSDMTTMTVIYPDVAVGDTMVLKYRLTQTDPLFPGQFSASELFYTSTAYDDVRVRIEYPESLWVQYEGRGMQEKRVEAKGGWKAVEWTYSNPKPIKNERRDYSVFDPDKETGYAFTTFKSYADIAAAYGVRALPRAEVTDRIQKLAATIVKDAKQPKDEARAIYEWVSTNITYAGNCIGIGAVVPRELSYVLDNKMGDCKDHATLLQALLAARGIRSNQVLVNAGSVYRLPKIPVVSSVNHVINYLPTFDLYLDSTSESTPYGILPQGDRGKPVLRVGDFKEGTMTPVPAPGANSQVVKSILKVSDNGSVTGTVDVSQTGDPAVSTRAWARTLTRDWEDDFVKEMFRARGMIGSGKFVKDDASALADHYHYRIEMSAEKFIRFPGAGAFYLVPPANAVGSINNLFSHALVAEKNQDTACRSGALSEEYTITLPPRMKVLYVPENLKKQNSFLKYEATYSLKGNVLKVKRVMTDNTREVICSPQVYAEYIKFGEAVQDNLKSPVLYK